MCGGQAVNSVDDLDVDDLGAGPRKQNKDEDDAKGEQHSPTSLTPPVFVKNLLPVGCKYDRHRASKTTSGHADLVYEQSLEAGHQNLSLCLF